MCNLCKHVTNSLLLTLLGPLGIGLRISYCNLCKRLSMHKINLKSCNEIAIELTKWEKIQVLKILCKNKYFLAQGLFWGVFSNSFPTLKTLAF
jgi:hypothetical protein